MAAATATVIAAAGLALAAGGTYATVQGQKKAAAASNRQERLRERQMNLDVARQQRQILREAIVTRSQAIASAVGQGAAHGSGLAGGIAQVTGASARESTYSQQSAEIGTSMFAANRAETNAGTLAATGQGLSNFGGMLVGNADMLGRVGTYYGTRATRAYA